MKNNSLFPMVTLLMGILFLVGCKNDVATETADSTADTVLKIEYTPGDRVKATLLPVKENGLYGLADTTGRMVVPCQYTAVPYTRDGQHFIVRDKSLRQGVINAKGKTVIPMEYKRIEFVRERGFAVYNMDGECSLTDIEGKTLMDFAPYIIVEQGHDLPEPRFMVYTNDKKYRIVDIAGQSVTSQDYNMDLSCGDEWNNWLPFIGEDGLYGVVRVMDGKEVVPPRYRETYTYMESDVLWAKNADGKYALFDGNGKQLSEFIYSDLFYDSKYYRVKRDNKWGCIDSLGNEVVPCVYDNLFEIIGLTIVEKNGLRGVLDIESGKMVAPVKYDRCLSVGNDAIEVFDSTRSTLLTRKGDTIFSTIKGSLWRISNGYMTLRVKNHFTGLLDPTGRNVIPCIYSKISFCNNYTQCVIVQKQSKSGLMDVWGREILPCEYDYLFEVGRLIGALKDNKYSLFDPASGKMTGLIYDKIVDYDGFYLVKQGNHTAWLNDRMEVVVPFRMDADFNGYGLEEECGC